MPSMLTQTLTLLRAVFDPVSTSTVFSSAHVISVLISARVILLALRSENDKKRGGDNGVLFESYVKLGLKWIFVAQTVVLGAIVPLAPHVLSGKLQVAAWLLGFAVRLIVLITLSTPPMVPRLMNKADNYTVSNTHDLRMTITTRKPVEENKLVLKFCFCGRPF